MIADRKPAPPRILTRDELIDIFHARIAAALQKPKKEIENASASR